MNLQTAAAITQGAVYVPLTCWQFSGLLVTTKLGGETVRHIYHEIRPFYLTLAVVQYIAMVAGSGHLINVRAGLALAMNLANWFIFRNADDDDDRWKRRRKKAAEKVARLGSRLAVVPSSA